MFDQMVDSIREDSVKMLLTIEIRQAGAAPKREQVAKPTGEGFVPGNGAPGVKAVSYTHLDVYKRQGLDYWHYLDISYYDGLDDFFAKNSGPYRCV